MGRAARAKESRGNREPDGLKVHFIRADSTHRNQVGPPCSVAAFSDRSYLVDHATGQIRRVTPTPGKPRSHA